jgi:hypothetical protein
MTVVVNWVNKGSGNHHRALVVQSCVAPGYWSGTMDAGAR